jgi:hypothetical protein
MGNRTSPSRIGRGELAYHTVSYAIKHETETTAPLTLKGLDNEHEKTRQPTMDSRLEGGRSPASLCQRAEIFSLFRRLEASFLSSFFFPFFGFICFVFLPPDCIQLDVD